MVFIAIFAFLVFFVQGILYAFDILTPTRLQISLYAFTLAIVNAVFILEMITK